MYSRLTLIFALAIGITSCTKDPKPQDTVPPTLIGKWETTSMRYRFYINNQQEADTTIYPPYAGFMDPLRSLEFSADSVFIRVEDDTLSFKYQKSGNAILGMEDGISDTLLVIDNLTDKNFDFTYTEEYEEQGENHKVTMSYKSIKK